MIGAKTPRGVRSRAIVTADLVAVRGGGSGSGGSGLGVHDQVDGGMTGGTGVPTVLGTSGGGFPSVDPTGVGGTFP